MISTFVAFLLLLLIATPINAQQVQTRVATSNNRLSFVGELASGNTAGSTNVLISTTDSSTVYSTASAHLVNGDWIQIGNNPYRVSQPALSASNEIPLDATTPLLAEDSIAGTSVLHNVSGFQMISMQTIEAVPNGVIRILVPATANNNTSTDGIADRNAYDLPSTAQLTCPQGVTGFDFATPQIISAEISGLNIAGQAFHQLLCPYTGAGPASDFGISNEAYITISNLINPAPKLGHTVGDADFSPWRIQQLASDGSTVIFSELAQPSVVESTRLRANVIPYFTFTVLGVNAGTTTCGTTVTRTSSATLVDFGEITTTAFTDMAQRLDIATNYPTGYVVTITSSDQMGLLDNANVPAICSGSGLFDYCLPSSQRDGMTATTSATWANVSQGGGLAYTMQNISGTDNVFDYTSGYKHLPDSENGDSPVTIMQINDSNKASNYACYRLSALERNVTGVYENEVTYTATASF